MKVLITGANGFIGQNLVASLCKNSEHQVFSGFRHHPPSTPNTPNYLVTGDLGNSANLQSLDFSSFDCVVHTAGYAHRLNEPKQVATKQFQINNVEAVQNIAQLAKNGGVKRLVFISSIGVNGPMLANAPISEHQSLNPIEPYGESKLQAEQRLIQVLSGSSCEWVIIRPTLVYGWNAPGNFARLLRIVERQWPLPFANIENQRSFISNDNLSHFISTCIEHPKAANEVFVIADGYDVSTPELISRLALGMGVETNLLPIPKTVLKLGATLLGKQKMYQQLCESYQVNIDKAKRNLAWQPPQSTLTALRV